MTPAKIYAFTVPALGSFPLLVIGDFFKIIESTGDLEVRGDSFGQLGPIKAGQGLEKTAFKRLEIKDLTGSANNVKLLVADEHFVDDRISGVVEIVDGAKNRTAADQGFIFSSILGASPGNYNQTTVYNPTGSGKRVVVNSIVLSNDTNSSIFMVKGAGVPQGAQSVGNTKLIGSANAPASSKYDLTQVAVPAATIIAGVSVAAGQSFLVPLTEPIVILPGSHFGVRSSLGAALGALIQVYEEALP